MIRVCEATTLSVSYSRSSTWWFVHSDISTPMLLIIVEQSFCQETKTIEHYDDASSRLRIARKTKTGTDKNVRQRKGMRVSAIVMVVQLWGPPCHCDHGYETALSTMPRGIQCADLYCPAQLWQRLHCTMPAQHPMCRPMLSGLAEAGK